MERNTKTRKFKHSWVLKLFSKWYWQSCYLLLVFSSVMAVAYLLSPCSSCFQFVLIFIFLFFFHIWGLVLINSIVVGVINSIFLNNAGGALDRSGADHTGIHTWDYICNLCIDWMTLMYHNVYISVLFIICAFVFIYSICFYLFIFNFLYISHRTD